MVSRKSKYLSKTLLIFVIFTFFVYSVLLCYVFRITTPRLFGIISAGPFRKPVRKSANPQIADPRFWFADLRTDFLPQTFADLR